MPAKRILLLGGTALARKAASVLVEHGYDVMTSLVGVTHSPHLPKGLLRVGGFGGIEGLRTYFTHAHYDLMVDATHAFAVRISANASACGARLIRLENQAWQKQFGDDWCEVGSMAAAVDALPHESKVLVTVGRKEVGQFFARADLSGVARMIEQLDGATPPRWQVVLVRPPFSVETEANLLRSCQAQFLVCKNAGGARPSKLDAATALGVPVIMVKRPLKPAVATVHSVAELVAAI